MMSHCHCFFEVDPRKRHEDERLKECYEDFKKPEWKNEQSSNESCVQERPEVGHDTDEGDTCEDVTEESDWEWEHSCEFSDEMNPSDRNVDDLLYDGRTWEVKQIVSKVCEESLVDDRCNLSDEYYRGPEDECCRKICVDRSEVMECLWEDESYPVEYESCDIRHEDEYEECPNNREELTSECAVSDETREVRIKTADDVLSKGSDDWIFFICKKANHEWEGDHKNHQNPGRNHCCCELSGPNMEANCLTRKTRNMRPNVCFGCEIFGSCCLHGGRIRRLLKTRKLYGKKTRNQTGS